ncbi:MAG: 7-carboxy-7-deazaguanine synthase QueE [Betaproteobacteria bacterium]
MRKAEGKKASPVRTRADTVRINEIFFSLQGESSRVGIPTVFVRLTGCPLRCGYCDTAYAFHDGKTRDIDEVIAEVARHPTNTVCVTGGEPLAQKNCHTLLEKLCELGYSVSLETSGAIDIAAVDQRVSRIVDIKTPGSGEVEKNLWENLPLLNPRDEIKFVITSEDDYRWAAALLTKEKLTSLAPVLFSPSFNDVSAAQLAEWILRDGLNVRMQIQLHKIIWGEKRGV